MGCSACQWDLLARWSEPSSVGLWKYLTQNLESIILKEICDQICLHVPDEKSESVDVKEEPSFEGSRGNDREIHSGESDSEASESEKDSDDDESETKYFGDAESDDASEEN